MRFIDRSKLSLPEILFDKRTDQARRELENFISQTQQKGGTRRAPQSEWLDEDALMRRDMAERFEHRCAYCEAFVPFDDETRRGFVGRHRPAMLAQDENGRTELLAYAWLIYEWENLLWVCSTCARLKGNQFFVGSKRGQPFMSVKELREVEQEQMLDPCFQNPTQHLQFELNGYVSARSKIGENAISILSLNRRELLEGRQIAMRDFADALRFSEVKVSTSVLSLRDSETAPPHAGAITQIVRAFAETLGIHAQSEELLAESLNSFTREERRSFADSLLGRAEGYRLRLSASPSQPTPPTKKRQPSRIPKVSRLPNALHPIRRVEISNFKALREISFDLPEQVADAKQSPCMLLLGENATGKSSVLEAMALAIIGSKEASALDEAIGTEDLSPADLIHRPDPYRWSETAPGMGIRLFFLDSSIPAGLTARAGDSHFSGDAHCSKVVLAYGPRRYFTTRRTRRFRDPAHRVRSLFDPMDMIANPIDWLLSLKGKHWAAAARALREVLMLADDDDFERDDDPDTPGRIYIRQGEQRVAMKDLSVGYKSVIAMVCDIIREMFYHYDNLEFASAVVFIDEVETHLHPRWKMQIMTLLRRAFPKIQFIATTHDPLCLRGMYDGEVFVLQRSTEDQVERVADLPSIRGMRAEQILTSEFFGLGSTDPETDARLLRYNRLAARIETLTDEEHAEMRRLQAALDDGMVLGSSLREQAYVEALKSEVNRQDVNPTKIASPRRADLRATFSALFEKRS